MTGTVSLGATQTQRTAEAPFRIHNGFWTGRDFVKDMSSAQQSWYAMGFINGMFVAPAFGATTDRIEPLERCIEYMTGDQAAAIILKHLQSHPERWHYQLNAESWVAMTDACMGK
jgi:hypothetical protein